MITVLLLILFSPPSQEQFNWLLLVGVTVRVLESDINGGVSLTLPEYPDEEVSSSLLTTPPVAYLLLWYGDTLVDEGFIHYAVRGEVPLYKVEKLVMHLIMTCNNKPYVSAAKSVTFRNGLRATIAFILKVRVGQHCNMNTKKKRNSTADSTVLVTTVPCTVIHETIFGPEE